MLIPFALLDLGSYPKIQHFFRQTQRKYHLAFYKAYTFWNLQRHLHSVVSDIHATEKKKKI